MSDPASDMLCAVAPEGCFLPDPGTLPAIPPADQHAARLIFVAILLAALLSILDA